MIPQSIPSPKAISSPKSRGFRLTNRLRLLVFGFAILIVGLLTIGASQAAYDNALRLFRGIVLDNSVKVDAAIQSLQHIAGVNKYAADLIASLNPEMAAKSKTALYAEFENFRTRMFTIRGGAISSEEMAAYLQAERAIYNEYGAYINKIIDTHAAGNKTVALQTFSLADKTFEEKIAPAILTLERVNYDTMIAAKDRASRQIYGAATLLAILLIGLAALLTALSFWLRLRVHRYLTPGIDAAVVMGWLMALIMITGLIRLPEQLHVMVQDSYYSITASARVLVDANRANVTESAALNDPASAAIWQQKYDSYMRLIALRMCGRADCMTRTFATGGADKADPAVAKNAKGIASQDSAAIDQIVPLMGNITFAGEVETLEKARLAYLDYLRIDGQTRALLAANKLNDAVKLNTGASDEAFFRFIGWVEQEKAINRKVFDRVWTDVEGSLPAAQLGYGLLGLGVVLLLCAAGVYHRYREL